MDLLRTEGLIQGYRDAIGTVDYPPFSTIGLWLAERTSAILSIDLLASFKIVALAFQLLAAAVIWVMARSVLATAFFLLSTTISAFGLGAIDIYLAAPVLIYAFAIRRNRYVTAVTSFCVALFCKWQPLLVAPLLALHLFQRRGDDRLGVRQTAVLIAIPIAFSVVLIWIFGLHVVRSFGDGMYQQGLVLSANAANPYYLGSMMVAGFQKVDSILSRGQYPGFPVMQLPFYVALVVIIGQYWRSPKTGDRLIVTSILLFWAYYLLSSGVHENHLAMAAFMVFALDLSTARARSVAIATTLAFNVNLLAFYWSPLVPVVMPDGVLIAMRAAACVVNLALGLWAIWNSIALMRRRDDVVIAGVAA